ncbi:MAG: hypothetical protein II338_02260, partial [Bacteroidaceae bacterium]|nr:hypothetical protein [Bacteroidaceae bacterium]
KASGKFEIEPVKFQKTFPSRCLSYPKIVKGERNTKKGRSLLFYSRAVAYLGRQPKRERRAESLKLNL